MIDHAWPYTYSDTGLLVGPLRMERARISRCSSYGGDYYVWQYCWDDPGIRERVRAEVDAIIDFDMRHKRPMKDRP